MRYIHTFTLILLFLLIGINQGNAQIPPGSFDIQLTSGNNAYLISGYIPENFDATKSYPVILALHGMGMQAATMRNMLLDAAKALDVILICPDENQLQDGSATNAAASYFFANYNIDLTRNIMAGYSWGGGMAYASGLHPNSSSTGIIGIAPAIKSLGDDQWNNLSNKRMATIIGDADEIYSEGVDSLMKEIQNTGADLKYIVKPGVTHQDNYFFTEEFINDFIACYDFVTNSDPNLVRLSFPDNGFENLYPDFDFEWKPVDSADTYTIQVSELEDFSSIIEEETINDLTYLSEELQMSRQYYWRVRGNNHGEEFSWSKANAFSTCSETGYINRLQTVSEPFTSDDKRIISYYIPNDYSSDISYSLILGLHGGGRKSTDYVEIMQPFAESRTAIVVCPDGSNGYLDDEYNGDEVNILEFAINQASEKYNINEDAIYLTGWSLGGRVAMYYGLDNYSRFKGIIGLSPAFQSNNDADNTSTFNYSNCENIPVCMISGTNDSYFYPFINRANSHFEEYQGRVLYKVMNGAYHDVFSEMNFNNVMNECFDFIDNPQDVDDYAFINSRLKVWPNPVNDYLNISLDKTGASGTAIEISNLNGEVLFESDLGQSGSILNHSIDISSLAPGLYILKIQSGSEIYITKIIRAE